MKVVHPASTALLITSLLLVHTQTILVVADDGDKNLLLAGGDGILDVGGDGSLDAQDGGAICCLPGGGANLNSCTSGPTLRNPSFTSVCDPRLPALAPSISSSIRYNQNAQCIRGQCTLVPFHQRGCEKLPF